MEIDKKIYKGNAVRIGALLGGPLTVAYLLASNFKALGQPEKASKAWIIGIAVSVVLFGVLFSLPEETSDKIPNFIIPLFTVVVAQFIVSRYQESGLQQHLEEGGQAYSIWRAVGLAILLAIITLGVAVGIALLVDSLV